MPICCHRITTAAIQFSAAKRNLSLNPPVSTEGSTSSCPPISRLLGQMAAQHLHFQREAEPKRVMDKGVGDEWACHN